MKNPKPGEYWWVVVMGDLMVALVCQSEYRGLYILPCGMDDGYNCGHGVEFVRRIARPRGC